MFGKFNNVFNERYSPIIICKTDDPIHFKLGIYTFLVSLQNNWIDWTSMKFDLASMC